ncbi:hypothetical protein ACTXT7_006485 [Hymenolepis weldensis]
MLWYPGFQFWPHLSYFMILLKSLLLCGKRDEEKMGVPNLLHEYDLRNEILKKVCFCDVADLAKETHTKFVTTST